MVFSKLRVVVTCLHRLFSRKSVFYGRCVAQNWTQEQSRDLLAVQPAFLWLYSSSSSNNTPLRAACDPLYPHSFPAKKKKKKCTARSLPSLRAVSCSYRNAQLCAFLLGCILFHPDRLLRLPSPFSELQPRLPERLQALGA